MKIGKTGILIVLCVLTGCTSWKSSEKEIISGQPDVMRVYTIDNPEDSVVLRTVSKDLRIKDLNSDEYSELSRKLIATVTDPAQDGVGIAGPQVGINRRVVAVQRFDKTGNPFEVYPNIRILGTFGNKEAGIEGCLSVPDMRGTVMRYKQIIIAYTNMNTMKDTTEMVEGYTAVIFQHETDHLDGIIYTDIMEK